MSPTGCQGYAGDQPGDVDTRVRLSARRKESDHQGVREATVDCPRLVVAVGHRHASGPGGGDGLRSRELTLSRYLPPAMLSLGQSIVAPVIPGFAKSFEVTFGTASLVFVMLTVGALVATFPAGYLMDKIGRKPALLAGPVLT